MKLKQTFGSSDFISLRFDMQRQSRRYIYVHVHSHIRNQDDSKVTL